MVHYSEKHGRLILPESIQRFRKHYQQTKVPRYYSGILHAVYAASILIGAIVFHARQIQSLSWKECWAFPIIFLISNWVEYIIHRYQLHRQVYGLKRLYQIHSKQHHQYFTDQAIAFESTRDFMMILFPPWAPILVAAASTALGYFVFGPLFSPNIGHIFGIIAPAALLLYEIMHCYYHISDSNPLTRIPGLKALRQHHRDHHNLHLMTQYNFNVTFPICDWIYGTTSRR